ncbi:hypothetical protein INT48_002525 [Thamnidium elegans]|uniref:F-box domain-containing protein n=1 Tax=Thamnidium elegans TaxID=101142 RepID=A0A8H7SYP2_9FUNG|nr:hypothetical protein INT48_002525 [Thamnidium elegans]
MMQLTQLPLELQLLIINHIKKDNHLDLAPLSQTCLQYFTMVADRFNWTRTVAILQPSKIHSSSLNYLMNVKSIKKRLTTKRLEVHNKDTDTIGLVVRILENQQTNSTINEIEMMIPTNAHDKVYQTLTNFPQTQLNQFTIRDPTDDGYIMAAHDDSLLRFLSTTLSQSQLTLQHLDISSFPSNILLSQFNTCQFPLTKSLRIALVGCQDQEHFHQYWRQFKSMFPNLKELTLTLTKQNVSLFKYLIQDISLFPWVRRLTITSRETPKGYLSREELRTSLLQLSGLNRITAGWDMIALT